MLKKRIITGVIIVAFLFAALFLLPPLWFSFILIAIGVLGSIEWVRMSDSLGMSGLVLVPAAVAVFSLALNYWSIYGILYNLAGIAVWLILAAHVIGSPEKKLRPLHSVLIAVAVIGLAVFSMADLVTVMSNGALWLAGMFVLVGVADSAAFFTGRRFGKTKLAPHISPGKTREGLIGGLLIVWAGALASGVIIWPDSFSQMFKFAMICLICAIFSVLGDLYISLQKRHAGVKDSGTLLPGHGGILDRIDSTLAVSPIYAILVKTLF